MAQTEEQTAKVPVQIRLPKDLVKQLDHLAIDRDVYRQELIEAYIRKGLSEEGTDRN